MTRLLQYLLKPTALQFGHPLFHTPDRFFQNSLALVRPRTTEIIDFPPNLTAELTRRLFIRFTQKLLPHIIRVLQPASAQTPAVWALPPSPAHPPCKLQQHVCSGIPFTIQRLAVVFIKIGRHGSRAV